MTTDGLHPVETALGYHYCLLTVKTRPGFQDHQTIPSRATTCATNPQQL